VTITKGGGKRGGKSLPLGKGGSARPIEGAFEEKEKNALFITHQITEKDGRYKEGKTANFNLLHIGRKRRLPSRSGGREVQRERTRQKGDPPTLSYCEEGKTEEELSSIRVRK